MILLGTTWLFVYACARLEMSRYGAAGVVVIAVAMEILMMSLWVFAGPV